MTGAGLYIEPQEVVFVETKAGRRLPYTIHKDYNAFRKLPVVTVVVDWPAADSDQPVPDVHSLDEVVRSWSKHGTQ